MSVELGRELATEMYSGPADVHTRIVALRDALKSPIIPEGVNEEAIGISQAELARLTTFYIKMNGTTSVFQTMLEIRQDHYRKGLLVAEESDSNPQVYKCDEELRKYFGDGYKDVLVEWDRQEARRNGEFKFEALFARLCPELRQIYRSLNPGAQAKVKGYGRNASFMKQSELKRMAGLTPSTYNTTMQTEVGTINFSMPTGTPSEYAVLEENTRISLNSLRGEIGEQADTLLAGVENAIEGFYKPDYPEDTRRLAMNGMENEDMDWFFNNE